MLQGGELTRAEFEDDAGEGGVGARRVLAAEVLGLVRELLGDVGAVDVADEAVEDDAGVEPEELRSRTAVKLRPGLPGLRLRATS